MTKQEVENENGKSADNAPTSGSVGNSGVYSLNRFGHFRAPWSTSRMRTWSDFMR